MKFQGWVLVDATRRGRARSLLAVVAMVSNSSLAQNPAPPGGAGSAEHIEGFTDTPMLPGDKWHQHDPNRPQPAVVTPANLSLPVPPPSDAEVLFDGKDLSKWEGGLEKDPNWKGQGASWKVQDGYVQVSPPDGTDIRTKQKWTDFQLHVEWATPTQTAGLHGQSRGNSGVLINGMYEIQVLDSYNDKTYPDGQAGALYGQMPPLVNPSKPPGEWQTYDIIWESPRWDDKGEMIQKPSLTLIFNGVVVQHRTEPIGRTEGIGAGVAYKGKPFFKPHEAAVFIQLQNHHSNPVRFRNIWIRDLNVAERE
jgi:hypothetical protein